jgi:hypothetical protein
MERYAGVQPAWGGGADGVEHVGITAGHNPGSHVGSLLLVQPS